MSVENLATCVLIFLVLFLLSGGGADFVVLLLIIAAVILLASNSPFGKSFFWSLLLVLAVILFLAGATSWYVFVDFGLGNILLIGFLVFSFILLSETAYKKPSAAGAK